MASKWMLSNGDEELGLFTEHELQMMMAEKKLLASFLLKQEHSADWKVAHTLPWLFPPMAKLYVETDSSKGTVNHDIQPTTQATHINQKTSSVSGLLSNSVFKVAGFVVVIIIGAFLKYARSNPPQSISTVKQPTSLVAHNDLKSSPITQTANSSTFDGATESTWSPRIERTIPQRNLATVTMLEKFGYSRDYCLYCLQLRSVWAKQHYNDHHGFGMCAECGQDYDALKRTLQAMQAGYQPSQNDAIRVENFKGKGWTRSLDNDQRRTLGLFFMSGQFATGEWNVLVNPVLKSE